MTPQQLLNNPHTQQAKQWLALMVERHIQTGESMDSLLGLSNSGYSALQPRTQHLKERLGKLKLELYLTLQQQSMTPRQASDRICDVINASVQPGDDLQAELWQTAQWLGVKATSKDYAYSTMRRVELDIYDVLTG